MYIEGLDVLDNMILNVIKNNARMSYSEIGEKVGVSRVSVKKRMETMEQKTAVRDIYMTRIFRRISCLKMICAQRGYLKVGLRMEIM